MESDRYQELVARVVNHLREDRIEKGLSMYRVGKEAQISARTISKIEKGEQSPTLYMLLRIAGAQGTAIGPILSQGEAESRS